MRPRLLSDPLSLARNRVLVALSLLAYCGAAIGFPLPQFQAKSGEAYPCQGHVCGCASAAQCWKSCCCYSPEQKLAWAQEHGVTPPAELIAEVRSRQKSNHANCPFARCSHGGCRHQGEPVAAPHGSCCAKPVANPVAKTSSPSKSDSSLPFVVVIGPDALGCQGLATAWCSSGAVTPPPAMLEWQFEWRLVEWLSPHAPLALCADLAPPVPPPRV